jgi:hypothetical protein
MYPFGYAQDKLSNLNRCGNTIRRFEEDSRSAVYYAFGKIIDENKSKVKRKKKKKNTGDFIIDYLLLTIDYFFCFFRLISVNRRSSAVQKIALAGFGLSRYSVQDSIMHQVDKWGFGAGMYEK